MLTRDEVREALDRSERYIREALELLWDEDVIPQLDAAIQCQRIAMGEADPSTMDDRADSCSCPVELAARGGFTSTCPTHGGGS
ncbi:hypothetical protein [Actinomadura rudentiformis]|uniref:Uncharacterized protein n=1 Tax=Actinomadura rudentiformis TaxID=359158 RepID=A0A6H9YT03_9ACTN|nr:hypothetical protein [Actinomadura rudentiformis]KAB2347290.1 hypothetical protein F8566_19960 [Actinomadura rudentiformis]